MAKKIDNQRFFKEKKKAPWKFAPMVVAWQFSSAENIGALLRLCDNFGIVEVLVVGDSANHKTSKIKRNATTSIGKIKWRFISENDVWKCIPKTFFKIAVDTTTESISLDSFSFHTAMASEDHINSFCFFFGNETIGLKDEVINKCDLSIHIPLIGNTLSMNVVQSAAVTLFEATRQHLIDSSF